MSEWSAETVAARIDHTLLAPAATDAEAIAAAQFASESGCASVCLAPARIAAVMHAFGADAPVVCTVIGFPHGNHTVAVKVAEAVDAATTGAREFDVVVDRGMVAAGQWIQLEAQLQMIRDAVPRPLVTKVILETSALDEREIIDACLVAREAGFDFVKTSTGFDIERGDHGVSVGGATLGAVRTMVRTVGASMGVKASGGIAMADVALSYLDAGATRIGTSKTGQILDQIRASTVS